MTVHWPLQSGYFALSSAPTPPIVVINAAAIANATVELRYSIASSRKFISSGKIQPPESRVQGYHDSLGSLLDIGHRRLRAKPKVLSAVVRHAAFFFLSGLLSP